MDQFYSRIVDFRNQIVHAYFGIDEEIVWNVIKDKIMHLYNDILLKVKEKKILLTPAIKASMVENSHNNIILSFLDNLQRQI